MTVYCHFQKPVRMSPFQPIRFLELCYPDKQRHYIETSSHIQDRLHSKMAPAKKKNVWLVGPGVYYARARQNTSLVAKGALAYRLQRRTACNAALHAMPHCLQCRTACNAALPAKSNMAARGPQIGGRGLERCLPLGFWPLILLRPQYQSRA